MGRCAQEEGEAAQGGAGAHCYLLHVTNVSDAGVLNKSLMGSDGTM